MTWPAAGGKDMSEQIEENVSAASEQKEKKNKFSLRKKLIIAVVILIVLISATISLNGYDTYKESIERLYNERGYVVGDLILNDIDPDDIARYADTFEPDDEYEPLFNYLNTVTKATGAAYIYIVVPYEDGMVRYIYDSSSVDDNGIHTMESSIGGTDPISAHYDEVMAAYNQAIRPDDYIVRHSPKYGYLTSSILPVIDSDGDVCALLFVDTWMETLESECRRFILEVVGISLIFLIVFTLIYWNFMEKRVLHPFFKINKSVRNFIKNDAQVDDSLNDIKTKDELEELAESLFKMENDLISYIENLKAVTAEKERIGAELNVATQIQADMLPSIFPAFPDRKELDIYATMDPAKEVGGDFYDYFFADDDHLALIIADVSGKGVPAALFMVIAKTLIKNRTQASKSMSPARILTDVNNSLCEGNEAGLFVTVWMAIIDIKTGKGKAVNAGHEHPAIRRKDGKYELIKYPHLPALAIMEGVQYKEREFELYPGDGIYVYTDGVAEATNISEELFGEERTLEALNADPGASPDVLLGNVKKAIDDFVGDAPQFDDITMLGFTYFGE